jgi:hypothetical protein
MGMGSCENWSWNGANEFPQHGQWRDRDRADHDGLQVAKRVRIEWAAAWLTAEHVVLTRSLTSQDAISGMKTHRQEA